jgi:dethiobiotin synthetase
MKPGSGTQGTAVVDDIERLIGNESKPSTIRSFIVLGTGPVAGQTLVATALVRSLCERGVNAIGMKPLAKGVIGACGAWQSAELQRLAAVSAFGFPARALCSYMLESPLGHAGVHDSSAGHPTLASVVDTFRVLSTWADAVVVDGADRQGEALGLDFGSLELARALGLPFVFVVGLRPGCVADALRKVDALVHGGLECAGWVGNQPAPVLAEAGRLLEALKQALPGACLGAIPHLQRPSAQHAARAIDLRRAMQALAA